MIRELNDRRRRQMFQSKSRTSRLVRIESESFDAMVTYIGYIFGRTDSRTNSIRRSNETCICRFFRVDHAFRMQIRVFINANEKVGASQRLASPIANTLPLYSLRFTYFMRISAFYANPVYVSSNFPTNAYELALYLRA